jgi:hypothetical protein
MGEDVMTEARHDRENGSSTPPMDGELVKRSRQIHAARRRANLALVRIRLDPVPKRAAWWAIRELREAADYLEKAIQ